MSTVGWAAASLGGLALVAGSGVGIYNLALWGQLNEACPDRVQCSADLADTNGAYQATGFIAPTLIGLGMVSAAGGLVLLMLAPDEAEAAVSPRGEG